MAIILTNDQLKAVEDLSIRLGGKSLEVHSGREFTNEPSDTTIIVNWGEDPAEGCIVLDDGIIDLGGGSWPTKDELHAWAAKRNRMCGSSHDGPLPTHRYIDPATVPHQAAIMALLFERSEALNDYDESDGTFQGYKVEELNRMKDTIELLCELRDGSARVTCPADGVPE